MSILTELGFTVPPEIDRLAGELTFAEISAEQLSLLDRDVIVWDVSDTPEARSTIEGTSLYQLLQVAREGRGVFVEDRVLAAAMVLILVLSLPVVIDQLVPHSPPSPATRPRRFPDDHDDARPAGPDRDDATRRQFLIGGLSSAREAA